MMMAELMTSPWLSAHGSATLTARPAIWVRKPVTLLIDDKPVANGRLDHTVPMRFSAYAGMDIGRDNGGVVDPRYDDRKPFAFTGTVKKVVFEVDPHSAPEDEQALHAVEHHAHATHGLSA